MLLPKILEASFVNITYCLEQPSKEITKSCHAFQNIQNYILCGALNLVYNYILIIPHVDEHGTQLVRIT